MIWSSMEAMIVIDLIIIGLILLMLSVSWKLGMFKKGRMPRTGRLLIMVGVALTGLFYLADLFVMVVLPSQLDMPTAMSIMSILHLEIRWYVSFLSLLSIGSGLIVNGYHRRRVESQMKQAQAHIAAAQDSLVESEIRFRALAEQTPDSVYCFEFEPAMPIGLPIEDQVEQSHDAVLIECNQVFADAIGADLPARAVGTRLGDLEATGDIDSHTKIFREFIEQGYRLVDYKLDYSSPGGECGSLRISWSGVVQRGELVRIWGAEKDILEQRITKAALAGRLQFQQFTSELSTRLLTAADADAEQALLRCLEEAAHYLRTDHASIVWFDQDQRMIDVRYFWDRRGEPPDDRWPIDSLPWVSQQVLRGEPIHIGTADEWPPEAATDADSIAKSGLVSVALAPMSVAGETLGACVFGNVNQERQWDNQELADLQAIANLFANKVVRIDARNDLNQALSELRTAKSRLEAENVYLREEISSAHGFDELIGESDALMRCLRLVEQVAATDATVLLLGETGTGKELFARAIHQRSGRSDRALVKVNCAALPAELIESELFGHEKGAFTGAVTRRPGRFELADGGTLFLDEIADLPIDLQGKLLRVLQEGEFERVGSIDTISVDVRLIAATNRYLHDAVDTGQFRADLYYRISAFPIKLPALRDRHGDIPLLTKHFVQKHSAGIGNSVDAISASMMRQLQRHSWPGNIRELEGTIQRALISSTGPTLELAEPIRSDYSRTGQVPADSSTASNDLRENEREHIQSVLEQSDWKVAGHSGAATKLGVPPSTLRSKMKKLGISRPH